MENATYVAPQPTYSTARQTAEARQVFQIHFQCNTPAEGSRHSIMITTPRRALLNRRLHCFSAKGTSQGRFRRMRFDATAEDHRKGRDLPLDHCIHSSCSDRSIPSHHGQWAPSKVKTPSHEPDRTCPAQLKTTPSPPTVPRQHGSSKVRRPLLLGRRPSLDPQVSPYRRARHSR